MLKYHNFLSVWELPPRPQHLGLPTRSNYVEPLLISLHTSLGVIFVVFMVNRPFAIFSSLVKLKVASLESRTYMNGYVASDDGKF